jgi:predicted nucleotide-binding protein
MNPADLTPEDNRAIEAFQEQLTELQSLRNRKVQDGAFIRWRDASVEFLRRWLPNSEYLGSFNALTFQPGYFEVPGPFAFLRGCDGAQACLEGAIAHIQRFGSQSHHTARVNQTRPHKVFLGHGRNPLWRTVERYLEKDKKIAVEAWESESRAGEQIIEVLGKLLDSCTFAVLVVTGEDLTSGGGLRPRQNVVHEIGLFQGRIGFKKVALLEQIGTEGFSNIHGLQTIPFPDQHIEAAFPELERMLKREEIIS